MVNNDYEKFRSFSRLNNDSISASNLHIFAWKSLHGRVVKGVGHLGNDEAMEAGGREFDPRPGHYSRMSF